MLVNGLLNGLEAMNDVLYGRKEVSDMEKNFYNFNTGNLMRTDIKETDSSYEFEMDLPGYAIEDVSAELDEGYLTIKAEKKVENNEKNPETGKYIRRERFYGNCKRSFYVGEDVKAEDISASFKDGILKVSVAKVEKQIESNKHIAIQG
jgi:HSP20 family molecular chaperone IbpA